MQIQCRACFTKCTPRINKLTGKPEELCNHCLQIARYAAQGIDEEVLDEDVELSLDYLDIDTEGKVYE